MPTRLSTVGALRAARPAIVRIFRLLMALLRRFPLPYRNAWLLTDRPDQANDNTEHLFRHLHKHRPDLNLRFVLSPESADWKRLSAVGYANNLGPYGTLRWRFLIGCARNHVSSHPPLSRELAPANCRFACLGHGAHQYNLAGYLKSTRADVLIATLLSEYATIVDPEGPYNYTESQVRRTGLPRFDRLRELSATTPISRRTLVLLAPTWRQSLSLSQRPGVRRIVDSFAHSQYADAWFGLLASDRLRSLASCERLQIALTLHPLMEPALEVMRVPEHVKVFRSSEDVQSYLARAAVVVTDYSSVAFDAAYIDRPVVDYQFDRDLALSGKNHTSVQGYFDYHSDGFGPVVTDISAALRSVTRSPVKTHTSTNSRIGERQPSTESETGSAASVSRRPLRMWDLRDSPRGLGRDHNLDPS